MGVSETDKRGGESDYGGYIPIIQLHKPILGGFRNCKSEMVGGLGVMGYGGINTTNSPVFLQKLSSQPRYNSKHMKSIVQSELG